jgi:CBS domain-containing protein
MKRVADVMEREVLTVSPDVGVQELARRMLDKDTDGAAVVEGGRLVGVVTAMDLVFREKNVHLPTMFAFMDALIPLELGGRTKREMEKIAATDVRHIMTAEPYTATPATPIQEVATRMVEGHVGFVPVLDSGALVGAVTRRAMLRAIAAG